MTEHTREATRFGNYSLLKLLSYGAMTEILLCAKADCLRCKTLYIVKRLLECITADTDKMQAFIREAEISTSLTHQNVVCAHEFGIVEHNGKTAPFLAMEYVFGKNLTQLQKKIPGTQAPVKITLGIIQAVARGLEYIHSYCDPYTLEQQPIIHKDISPDNIIVSYRGEVKITDFGIARRGDDDVFPNKISGKQGYMSPEQRQNQPLDQRSDIYSLGIVLWECLTGEKALAPSQECPSSPLPATGEIIHPSEKNTTVPRRVGDICMKCLEPEAEKRFQSARELNEAIDLCLAIDPVSTADIKTFMAEQFADEFENESNLLAQVLNTTTSSSSREQPPIAKEPSAPSRDTIEAVSHGDFGATSASESLKSSPPEAITEQYATETEALTPTARTSVQPLRAESTPQQFREEITLVLDTGASDSEQTAMLNKYDGPITGQEPFNTSELTMVSINSLQQNTTLKVAVEPNAATQTDYEM